MAPADGPRRSADPDAARIRDRGHPAHCREAPEERIPRAWSVPDQRGEREADREVAEEVAREARLPEAAERSERGRSPQPEDLLRVLERERVPDVLVEVEGVRAEAEREQQNRRGATERAQAPSPRPQEHEQSRDEREPDQTRGHGETAEDAGPQGLATLCRQKRPRDEGEEERVRLRRREDEREWIERDEEQRVHGPIRAEERTSDPDERDGRRRRRDERDEDARDDRGARDPGACVDDERVEREERRRLLRVVAVLGDVEEPLRVPVRERVEEEV